ncbi:MAG: uracil-DNA glycosylase [Gammaproteobacteria bacterium]
MDARRRHYLDALGVQLYVRPPIVGAAPLPESTPVGAAPLRRDVPESPPAPVGAAPSRRELADASTLDWDTLQQTVSTCTACDLHRSRTQTVFGTGDRNARWMLVGEAPGAEEDRQGEPFVGRAGQLLNAMLAAAGAPRERVYIANTLKCRPPDNRDPKSDELTACRAFLDRQIALVEPELILVVGRIAAQTLLASDQPIGKLRGTVHRYGTRETPLVATYHPAYLLRSPGQKRRAWDDLKLALSVAEPVA